MCPFFLPYFVFLFLPRQPNSKFVFKNHLSWMKCAENIILLKSPIFALIRCLVYLQRCRSVYLQKGSSLEATVVGCAQKVCNISKWIGRGRIAKVKKEKWIGTARLAQAKLRRKEKMLLLLFLFVLRNQILWRAGIRLKLRSANRFYRILDVLHPVHQGWSLSLSST